MGEINLNLEDITELTELDLMALCQLNDFKSNELEDLDLRKNELINIDFIKENTPFINLIYLDLSYNYNLKNINNIKYVTNLEFLKLQKCKNLKDIRVIKYLKNLIYLDISNLNLDYQEEIVEILINDLTQLEKLYISDSFSYENFKIINASHLKNICI